MADFQVIDKTLETSIDRASDSILVYDASAAALRRTRVNNMLNITGAPVGDTDAATLTNKTITSPTISGPTLSGTIAGTYTIGGTPTFPSSVVTLTGSQTLTNKVLTSPTINTPTITNPTLTVDSIAEFTGAAGVTIDGVLLKDSKMNGSYITDATINTAQITNSAVDYTKVAAGAVVQVANTQTGTMATGTTVTPFDNTIPQITEGVEYMTLAFTPKSATNLLIIEIVAIVFGDAGISNSVGQLHQDSTANALASAVWGVGTSSGSPYSMTHKMTAGTTSSTTFRFRCGSQAAGTMTFNGVLGTAYMGGTLASSMTITEYKV